MMIRPVSTDDKPARRRVVGQFASGIDAIRN
jgi:hypothetical protein